MVVYLCGYNLDNKIVFRPNDEDGEIVCCPIDNNVINNCKSKKDEYKNCISSHPDCSSSFCKRNFINLELTISKTIWKKELESCWECSGYWAKNERRHGNNFSFFHAAKSIKLSENRIAVINSEGKVFVNAGRGWQQILLQAQTSEHFCNHASDVAVEDHCLLILDKCGTLFSSGIEITLPGVKISKMAMGSEHCLALSETGVVYSWGSGMRGQLGNGVICQVDTPEMVQSLQGVDVTDVKCGAWHSAALSVSGDVYMWGWNDVGQLGFPSKSLRSEGVKWHLTDLNCYQCCCPKEKIADDRKYLRSSKHAEKIAFMVNNERQSACINVQTSPKLLDYWRLDIVIKKVACGTRHTVFLLDDHSAWAVGWNKYGQLGIGSTESKDEPQLLSLFPVANIFAGGWNTALVQEIV